MDVSKRHFTTAYNYKLRTVFDFVEGPGRERLAAAFLFAVHLSKLYQLPMLHRVWLAFSFVLCLLQSALGSEGRTQPSGSIPLQDALIFRVPGRGARSVVHRDAVEAQIVSGQWHAPVAGEQVESAAGEKVPWEAVTTTNAGSLDGSQIRSGYVYWPVVGPAARLMLLEAAGHSFVYVNGEIRGGDHYGNGIMRLPVLLRPGTNEFLFQCSRGGLRARLTVPPGALLIDSSDSTLPDIIVGETDPVWGAVVLVNASTNDIVATLRSAGGRRAAEQVVTIPPLATRKAPFVFYPSQFKKEGKCPVTLLARSGRGAGAVTDSAQITLRVRRPEQSHKRTFVSTLDGSVQYYAVNPAPRAEENSARPALFLSLHGAGVEAMGQADSYYPKKWGTIVCPTNRRPYGFDWEEWGRIDALEVLALAEERFRPDPRRVYLTGHSMGGHGAWQLGALYPDRFAAIGPSAGWISFMSYVSRSAGGGTATNEVQRMLRRASATSDTLLLASNYLHEGVYILHGDADDNVPVTEAREMRRVLSGFHHDFDFHEQPGAGHWWDASDEPGTDCVDWAPMFDFFARHAIPFDLELRRVRFATVNPAVSSRCHWVEIVAQEHSLEVSAVDLCCDPGKRRIVGTTTNVASLWLDLPALKPGDPMSVELDGQKLENIPMPKLGECGVAAASGMRLTPFVILTRKAGNWQVGPYPAQPAKTPFRSGPFRQAFLHRMLFVYGTRGTPKENAWALAKARYDAETFWYRGNGSVDLMSDVEYVRARAKPQKKGAKVLASTNRIPGQPEKGVHGRNVILYGHSECNAAWPVLLGISPVQVSRGTVRVGDRVLNGDDLGCVFLRPDPVEKTVLVGVVAGSGLPGLRLTERFPYFMSGAGFPDCLVVGTDMLAKGVEGVRLAGFFGQDWGVETGDWATP